MPDVSLETILVAVIAGLGGGLAGTWLRIRHDTVVLIHLDGARWTLDAWPVPELERFSEQLAVARKYLAKFNTSALREIQGPPWWTRWRWVLWLRRHTHRLRRRLPGRKQEASE